MNAKATKDFSRLIGQHGLTLEHGKGHYAVRTKDGRRVGTVSHSGEVNALRQAVRDLVRQKLLPEEARRVKF